MCNDNRKLFYWIRKLLIGGESTWRVVVYTVIEKMKSSYCFLSFFHIVSAVVCRTVFKLGKYCLSFNESIFMQMSLFHCCILSVSQNAKFFFCCCCRQITPGLWTIAIAIIYNTLLLSLGFIASRRQKVVYHCMLCSLKRQVHLHSFLVLWGLNVTFTIRNSRAFPATQELLWSHWWTDALCC